MKTQIPEAQNIRKITRGSDFSVITVFASCRAASSFEKAINHAAASEASGCQAFELSEWERGFQAGKRSSEKWFVAGLCFLAVLGPTTEHIVKALL